MNSQQVAISVIAPWGDWKFFNGCPYNGKSRRYLNKNVVSFLKKIRPHLTDSTFVLYNPSCYECLIVLKSKEGIKVAVRTATQFCRIETSSNDRKYSEAEFLCSGYNKNWSHEKWVEEKNKVFREAADYIVSRGNNSSACKSCWFYSDSSFLKCAVNPLLAEIGEGCREYESTPTPSSWKEMLDFSNIQYRKIGEFLI